MNLNLLLSTLDKVRSNGRGRYQACCPAHNDKSPSMQITDNGQRILIHCFAGCTSDEILGACGLDHSVLYPEDNDTHRVREKIAQKRAEAQKQKEITDTLFEDIYKSSVRSGVIPTDDETYRYRAIIAKKHGVRL